MTGPYRSLTYSYIFGLIGKTSADQSLKTLDNIFLTINNGRFDLFSRSRLRTNYIIDLFNQTIGESVNKIHYVSHSKPIEYPSWLTIADEFDLHNRLMETYLQKTVDASFYELVHKSATWQQIISSNLSELVTLEMSVVEDYENGLQKALVKTLSKSVRHQPYSELVSAYIMCLMCYVWCITNGDKTGERAWSGLIKLISVVLPLGTIRIDKQALILLVK